MIDLTDETFDEVVNVGVTVVDFWATWCRPCQMIEPMLAELESSYTRKVKFARVDVDEHHKTALRNRVMGVPTVIYFVDGRPVAVLSTAYPEHVYKERLDQILTRSELDTGHS